jgi:hypothetical protein
MLKINTLFLLQTTEAIWMDVYLRHSLQYPITLDMWDILIR